MLGGVGRERDLPFVTRRESDLSENGTANSTKIIILISFGIPWLFISFHK